MLRELKEEGVDYVPVDPDHSTDKWELLRKGKKKTILVGPLTAIRGIGPAALVEILEARKNKTEIRPGLAKRLAGAKTDIDSLYPIMDMVKRSGKKYSMTPTPIREISTSEHGNQTLIIQGVVNKIAPLNENELLRVAKRGGREVTGPTTALNLFVQDDSDEMFCKVHARDYERIGKEIVEHGRAGKAVYALKGNISSGDFRMMWVKNVDLIGEL
jgi:uncharacterized protein YycO